ncbi:MAG: manganese efflux pump MntP family protein [Oscillospiraceae bacterium]
MGIAELLMIGTGLSMDAFAASVCKGLNMKGRINYVHAAIIALFFGGFQALMPLAGYILGVNFRQYITKYDHWTAFALLTFIGGKMIYEAFKDCEEESCCSDRLDIKELFILAVATGIDALAVGITFAFLQVNIGIAAAVIGATTFILSFAGVVIGNKFGSRYKNKAELAGGVILVLMGVKILLEHLGIL